MHAVTQDFAMLALCPDHIPSDTLKALRDWVNGKHAQSPGDFLAAVLSNDLIGAVTSARDRDLAALPWILSWLYAQAHIPCWGSREAVERWRERCKRRQIPTHAKVAQAATLNIGAQNADHS